MLIRSRGYLPHLVVPEGTYFITDRLIDSLPRALFVRWKQDLEALRRIHSKCDPQVKRAERQLQSKIEKHLDLSMGNCWLKEPRIAQLVIDAWKFFNGKRYCLHAWTVMPNHIHLLLTLNQSFSLSTILGSVKGFTSREANKIPGRSGKFWQREYFDKIIKTQRQFEFVIRYILKNPIKAGFCEEFYQWPWNGCSEELKNCSHC